MIGLVLTALVLARTAMAERRGDRAPALTAVLGFLALDAALFPRAGTANGLLLPVLGPLDAPVVLLLVPAVVLLRLLRAPRGLLVTASGSAWAAFIAWSAVAAASGLLAGNDANAAWEQVKGIVLVAGGAVLVAGTPWADLTGPRGLPRVVRWVACGVLALAATTVVGLELDRDLGLVQLVETGRAGSDFATLAVTLGLLRLGLLVGEGQLSLRTGLSSAVCVSAPVLTQQRASLVAMVVALAVLTAGLWSLRGRNGVQVPPVAPALAVVGLCVAAGVAVLDLVGLTLRPAVERVQATFTAQGQLDSVQSRFNQWDQAWSLVVGSPWAGRGLGEEYLYTEVIKDAPDLLVVSALTHNIVLDQLLRTGVVGAVLLLAALGLTAAQGWAAARRRPAPVAALALAGVAALTGLVARGMVESLLEKPRLALLLGVVVGVLCVVGRRSQARVPLQVETGAAEQRSTRTRTRT